MANSILSTSVQTFSPRTAQEWLDSINYPKNRALSRPHVEFYAKEMKRGAWEPTNTIAVAHINGHMAMVNGQHTLAAIAASGISQKHPVARYQSETEKDVDRLYAHFDKGKKRNYVDTLRAYDFPGQIGLSMSATQFLTSAVMVLEQKFPSSRIKYVLMSDEERIAAVLPWVDAYKTLDNVLTGAARQIRSKIIVRGCLPVALATIKHAPTCAPEFWRGVAHLEGLERSDSRGTLHRFLVSTTMIGGRNPQGWEPSDIWRGVAHAWNKYYRGASLGRMSSLKQLRNMYPQIVIEGTPYTG